MKEIIELGKKDAGFNEMAFVIQASDWKGKTGRPALEEICFDFELPRMKEAVTAATDGLRLHVVRNLGKTIEAKPGFYRVEKFIKSVIKISWVHNAPRAEFNWVHKVMFEAVGGTAIKGQKSEAVCQVIRKMDRSFSLSNLAEAMGYKAGLQAEVLQRSFITHGDTEKKPVAKFLGNGWESYVMPLRDAGE